MISSKCFEWISSRNWFYFSDNITNHFDKFIHTFQCWPFVQLTHVLSNTIYSIKTYSSTYDGLRTYRLMINDTQHNVFNWMDHCVHFNDVTLNGERWNNNISTKPYKWNFSYNAIQIDDIFFYLFLTVDQFKIV